MLQDVRLYQCFLTVAEELSFTAAAQRLNVAQPWLSTRIRQLEARLGLTLFNRTTRSVELTPEGARLAPLARRVIEACESFEREAADLGGHAPVLRLGAPPYLPNNPQSRELMRRLEAALPGLRLEMDVGWSLPLVHKASSGELDAAFTIGVPPPADLEQVLIDEVLLDIEFPEGDSLAERGLIAPKDLAGRWVVMFNRSFNSLAFDRISAELRGHGANIVERNAMWSTRPVSPTPTPPLVIRLEGGSRKTRPGFCRRPLEFIEPLELWLVRGRERSSPALDLLFRLAREPQTATASGAD